MEKETIQNFLDLINNNLHKNKKGLEFYEIVFEDNIKIYKFVFFIYNDVHKIDYYLNNFELKELDDIGINYTLVDYDYMYFNNGVVSDYYNEFIIEILENDKSLKKIISKIK